jgi:hypothetical protein
VENVAAMAIAFVTKVTVDKPDVPQKSSVHEIQQLAKSFCERDA